MYNLISVLWQGWKWAPVRPLTQFLSVVAMVGLCFLFLSTAGCSSDQPPLVEVSGRVTMRGEPLTAGAIYLTPDATNRFQGDQPSSLLETDGSFRIKTYPYGEGVPPGKYAVTLAPALAARIRRPDLADPKKSPWQVDVPSDGLRDQLFEVK